jgi:branched-subunit amino acid aminotransferase/4-amino-4-deoxychorismate lyase
VIELARDLALDVQEAELRPDELRRADEIFITSTLREVLPVTRVDDWTVGDGRVGPVALELRRRYQQLVGTDSVG